MSDDLVEAESINKVIIIACLGGTDDFIIYLSFALGETFDWYELIPGVVFGGIIISVFVGCVLQSSETAARYATCVPLPAVVLLLAAYIVITGFVKGPDFL